jgi:hypothetical protein
MAFETLRHRISIMSTSKLEKEFALVRNLRSYSPANEIYHDMIVQELDLRDKEYTDWCSTITYEVE